MGGDAVKVTVRYVNWDDEQGEQTLYLSAHDLASWLVEGAARRDAHGQPQAAEAFRDAARVLDALVSKIERPFGTLHDELVT